MADDAGMALPGLDWAAAPMTVPVWLAAAAAALIVLLFVLAILRSGAAWTLASLAVVAVLAGAGWLGVAALEQWRDSERAAERRALDARLNALLIQATAPGSALACLDAVGGESSVQACERVVFGKPETVAAATALIGARLTLLVDAADYALRMDPAYEETVNGLRKSIEADPFGLAAHVLATRDDCRPDACDFFAAVRDPSRLRAHLEQKTFETLVSRHAAAWDAAPARTASAPANEAPALVEGRPSPIPPGFNIPSADSIPAVSIMNAEPATPPPAAAPTPEPAPPRPSPPARRTAQPQRPAAERPAQAPRPQAQQPARPAVAAPIQLGPGAQ